MSQEPKKIQLEGVSTPQEILNKPLDSQSDPNPIVIKETKDMPVKKKPLRPLIISLVMVIAGTASGYLLSQTFATNQTTVTPDAQSAQEVLEQGVKVGDVVGHPDKETFSDEAEGVLVKGGIAGEGSHHLMREGGPTQSVYLTSSVLDLDQLVNHRIKVWGETFAAQSAGWLMDVGRVEILELDAPKPFEAEEE